MSYDIWQLVQDNIKGDSEIMQSLMKNVKMTRPIEDSPCIFTGSVGDLAKFDQKVKNILGMFEYMSDAKEDSNDISSTVGQKSNEVSHNHRVDNDLMDQEASASVRPKFKAVTNNDAPPSGHELCLGIGKNLKIRVLVGKIDEQTVGAIVNPVFEYLGKTIISQRFFYVELLKVFLSLAGNDHEHAKRTCAQNLKKNMQTSSFKVGETNYFKAVNMPCKFVIDVCLPSLSAGNGAGDPMDFFVPVLQNCYMNCLAMCRFLEVNSIAFQALGHGK